MASADVGFQFHNQSNANSAKRLTSSIQILEDEIYALRTKMEQSYLEELSLSSEQVIDLSLKLDIKINEYMLIKRMTKLK